MKIRQNIQKRQGGGIIYTPFIPQYTTPGAQEISQKTSEDSNKITGTLQAEIVDVLKENGIPSDVDAFLGAANKFLRKAEITGEYTMSDLIRIQSLANRVQYNKSLYDATSQHLTSKGNWNEVALDNRGNIYVIDKDGNISTVSPVEYYQKEGQYQALTNNEIMSYRTNADSFNSSMLNDLAGSIGINDIVEYTKGIIMDMGTRSVTGYTNSELAKMEQSLMDLTMGGPTGYYKFMKSAQVDDSTERQALNYIINALPTNMKQMLMGKSAAEGQNPLDHSADLLAQALANHVDTSISVDFDSAATNSAINGGSSGSGTTKEVSYLENLATGSALGNYESFRIAPEGSQVSLNVKGQLAGPLRDRQGDRVEQNNLRELFKSVYGFQVVDQNAVTFGNQVINPTDYDKIVWDNSSQLIRVYLPYTTSADGKVTPDFALMDKVDEFQKQIDDMGGQITPNITSQIKQYFGDSVYFNPQSKQLVFTETKPFLSISAYANSNVMGSLNTNDKFLAGVDSQTGKQIKSDYDNAVSYYTAHGKQLGKDELVDQPRVKKGRFYRGNIYIPIISSTIGVHLSNGEERLKSEYMDVNGSAARQNIKTTWD